MVIRTFFDKNNTIQYNDMTNTGLNPVTELYYGGGVSDTNTVASYSTSMNQGLRNSILMVLPLTYQR